ncbi:MAG: cupin domain-containing protein [Lentisphaeria bacterium]|nr:cupin domain-containing protein [Lentisphaeria bacterium]
MAGASGVERQLPIGAADGTPSHSVRVFTLAPGGHTPWHEHPWEHLNYAIAGEGEIVAADGTAHPFAAGDFALVPPGEKHQYRNTSRRRPFLLLCAVPKEHE